MHVGMFNHTYYHHCSEIHTLRVAWQMNFVRNGTEGGDKRIKNDNGGIVVDYN